KQKLDQETSFKDRIKGGKEKLAAGKYEEALKDFAVAEQFAPNMEGQTAAAQGWDQARKGFVDEVAKQSATIDRQTMDLLLKLQELKTQADYYVSKQILYEQPKEAIDLYQRIVSQQLPAQVRAEILVSLRTIQADAANKIKEAIQLMQDRRKYYLYTMQSAKVAMNKGKFDKKQFSIAF